MGGTTTSFILDPDKAGINLWSSLSRPEVHVPVKASKELEILELQLRKLRKQTLRLGCGGGLEGWGWEPRFNGCLLLVGIRFSLDYPLLPGF